MKLSLKMASIEDLWHRLETTGPGGATRVDGTHPSDLYGATDARGQVGLVLLCDREPPGAPKFEAVTVTSNQRHDGRWALGIWLDEGSLRPVFTQLCDDLVATAERVPPSLAPTHILGRLARWRDLLERGAGSMRMTDLRGLIGELIVFDRCLGHWSADDVVSGWVGPLGNPQDFVLPGRRIEVKTAFASSRAVRITSLDQLDTDEPLLLAVVTLTTLVAGDDGLAPAAFIDGLIRGIRGAAGEAAVEVFRQRLTSARYVEDAAFDRPMFRVDNLQFFNVARDFPRLRRADVPAGIGDALYDVVLASCAPYTTSLAS